MVMRAEQRAQVGQQRFGVQEPVCQNGLRPSRYAA